MKKTTNYTFLALFIPFMFALVASGAFSGCGGSKKDEGRINYLNCDNFKVGDTLWPDYGNDDTLIVTSIASADTLNMIFAEPLPKVATDAEIDSVLHHYCLTFNQYVKHNIGLGYRKDIALHLALVDFKRIAPDALYQSIIED